MDFFFWSNLKDLDSSSNIIFVAGKFYLYFIVKIILFTKKIGLSNIHQHLLILNILFTLFIFLYLFFHHIVYSFILLLLSSFFLCVTKCKIGLWVSIIHFPLLNWPLSDLASCAGSDLRNKKPLPFRRKPWSLSKIPFQHHFLPEGR